MSMASPGWLLVEVLDGDRFFHIQTPAAAPTNNVAASTASTAVHGVEEESEMEVETGASLVIIITATPCSCVPVWVLAKDPMV